MHWGINLPVSYKIHWGINLPVSNNNTSAFIFLCLTNKRLKYLLLPNKCIYVILYQHNGNKDKGVLELKIQAMYIF